MKIRRYFRQPVVQEAVLRVPEIEDLPCEIRNFCLGGLLLKLDEQGAEKNLPRERRDESYIVFSAAGAAEPFAVKGRLSHVSPRGVGFAFAASPPFLLLQALQEKAMPPPQAAQGNPEELAEIHANCLQALEKALRPLAGALPAQIQAHLRDEEAQEARERQAAEVAGQFYGYVLAQARSFVVPDLSMQPEAGAIYTESQADRLLFEDWMNLVDKVIRLESQHEDTLKLLESRLSLLAGREILGHDNPFGPNVLCHSFYYSLKSLELDNAQRNRAYETFSRLLEEPLSKLYGELRVLSKSLDGLKGESEKKEEASYSRILTATPVSSPFSAAFHGGAEDAAAEFKIVPAKPPGPARAAAQAGGRPPRPDAYSAFVMLFRYAESQAGNSPTELASEAGRAAVAAALRKLQANTRNQPATYFNAPWLQAGLNQALAESGHEKALACADVRENLQILGLLLDAMLGDPTLPPCVSGYIKRLQMPLLIASLDDPALVHGQTHPAREFLNQLDYLTQAANADGELDNAELSQAMEGIFARLAGEADMHRAFEEALESLKKLTTPLSRAYTARLDRIVESCEGAQKLEHARRLADQEIDARIGGKSAPAPVLALLDAGWRQLLVLTNLRLGTDHDDWRRQLAAVDLLLAWLGKKPPANPPSPNNIQGLLKYIREKLPGIGADVTEALRTVDKIEKLLLGAGEAGPLTHIEVPPADTSQEQKEIAFRNRLQGFRTGEWLRFASARGAWIPLRLSWIGQNPSRYVFVNRKGVKNLDLDGARFTQFLDEKRASRMENLDELTLVERTAKSLLSTLRDRLR